MPTVAEYRAVRVALRDVPARGSVELILGGMGPQRSAGLCRWLDGRADLARGLALLGWAGALTPELAAGDRLVADVAIDEDGRRVPCRVLALPQAQIGPLLTVSSPLLTPEAKLARRRSGALAVEMEAFPLAAWAAARDVRFCHARVVLDPLAQSLPDLGDVLDIYGRLRSSRLLRRLVADPSLLMPMLGLIRQSRACSQALGALARSLVTATGC